MFPNLPAKARALNVTLIKMWEDGFEEGALGASAIMDICSIEGSDASENVYLFPQEVRGLRTRGADGALIPDAVQVYEGSTKNADKYRMIDVALNDYKDDKIGQYSVVARDYGMAAATGPVLDMEDLAIGADAATALCYDGTPFFGTAHPVDPVKASSGTWSNKLTKGAGLTFDTFGEVLQSMVKFPSATPGKAAGTMPSHLLVPADYFGMALDICTNEFPSGLAGARNKWIGLGIKPIAVPNWTRDAWMLADARLSKKRPFVFQEREKVALVPAGIDPDGAVEYERGTLRWIVKGRNGVGFAYPTKAVLVVK